MPAFSEEVRPSARTAWVVAWATVPFAVLALYLARDWLLPLAPALLLALGLAAISARLAQLSALRRVPVPALNVVGWIVVVALIAWFARPAVGGFRWLEAMLAEAGLWAGPGPEDLAIPLVLVLVYTAAMLADGGRLAARAASLGAGAEARLRIATTLGTIRNEAGDFLLLRALVAIVAAAATLGATLAIGVDAPALWTCLAAILAFTPGLGAAMATLLPALWAVDQLPDLGRPLAMFACLAVVWALLEVLMVPAVSGRRWSVGILGQLLVIGFWTTIWGVPGALLAVPLTMVGTIAARHIPTLRPVATLLIGETGLGASTSRAAPATEPPRRTSYGFSDDIEAIRRDMARDEEPAAAAPKASDVPAAAGIFDLVRTELAQWLGDEIGGRTGLDPRRVQSEVEVFLDQLLDDPAALAELVSAASSNTLSVVRRHPAALALLAVALGFVVSRMRK